MEDRISSVVELDGTEPPPNAENKILESLKNRYKRKMDKRKMLKMELLSEMYTVVAEDVKQTDTHLTNELIKEKLKLQFLVLLKQYEDQKRRQRSTDTLMSEVECRNMNLLEENSKATQQLQKLRIERVKARKQARQQGQYLLASAIVAHTLLDHKSEIENKLELVRWIRDTTLERAFDWFTNHHLPCEELGGIFKSCTALADEEERGNDSGPTIRRTTKNEKLSRLLELIHIDEPDEKSKLPVQQRDDEADGNSVMVHSHSLPRITIAERIKHNAKLKTHLRASSERVYSSNHDERNSGKPKNPFVFGISSSSTSTGKRRSSTGSQSSNNIQRRTKAFFEFFSNK